MGREWQVSIEDTSCLQCRLRPASFNFLMNGLKMLYDWCGFGA